MSAYTQQDIPRIFEGAKEYQNEPELLELAQDTFNEKALYDRIVSLARKLTEKVNIQGVRILDLCSATGLCALQVAEAIDVSKIVLVDTNEAMLGKAKRNFEQIREKKGIDVSFRKADAVTFGGDGPFDIILMNSAYHHIDNDRKVQFLSNAVRLLSNRGFIIVGEHFISSFESNDEFRKRVVKFYENLINELQSRKETKKAISVIRRSGLYCWQGEYEYKTSFRQFNEDITKAKLGIIQTEVVWQISDDVGTFALCLAPDNRLTIKQSVIQSLEVKRGKIEDIRESLKILERQSSASSNLSILTNMLQYHCGFTEDTFSEIVWINIELKLSLAIYKAANMWPIAILHRDVPSITSFLEPLLKGTDAWNKTVEENKWLPLSDVMDYWYGSHDISCYLLFLPNSCHRVNEFKNCELFKRGSLALIYPSAKLKKYVFLHRSLGDQELNVDEEIGKQQYSLSGFVKWLEEFESEGKKVGIYAGYESVNTGIDATSKGEPSFRFWVAFTQDVSKETIIGVRHFEYAFKEDYLNLILQTIKREEDIISWFLKPPGYETYPKIVWFDTKLPPPKGSHNPSLGLFHNHQDKVVRRFHDWVAPEDIVSRGEPAKALVHSIGYTLKRQEGAFKRFPAKRLVAFFRACKPPISLELEDITSAEEIALPVLPGLPFLLAVHKFMVKVFNETHQKDFKCVLKPITSDVIGIVVEHLEIIKYNVFSNAVRRLSGDQEKGKKKDTFDGGELKRALVDAAFAKVDVGQYKQGSLISLFKGTQQSCAMPFYDSSYIGLTWQYK